MVLPVYINSLCDTHFSSWMISKGCLKFVQTSLFVFSCTGWHSSMDSAMETSSLSLSLLQDSFFVSLPGNWIQTPFWKQFFFPHHLKDAHFVFLLPHRQMCLWWFLVTNISHKSNKHTLNYISRGRDWKKNQMWNVV